MRKIQRSIMYHHMENCVSVFLAYVLLQNFAGYMVSLVLHIS